MVLDSVAVQRFLRDIRYVDGLWLLQYTTLASCASSAINENVFFAALPRSIFGAIMISAKHICSMLKAKHMRAVSCCSSILQDLVRAFGCLWAFGADQLSCFSGKYWKFSHCLLWLSYAILVGQIGMPKAKTHKHTYTRIHTHSHLVQTVTLIWIIGLSLLSTTDGVRPSN